MADIHGTLDVLMRRTAALHAQLDHVADRIGRGVLPCLDLKRPQGNRDARMRDLSQHDGAPPPEWPRKVLYTDLFCCRTCGLRVAIGRRTLPAGLADLSLAYSRCPRCATPDVQRLLRRGPIDSFDKTRWTWIMVALGEPPNAVCDVTFGTLTGGRCGPCSGLVPPEAVCTRAAWRFACASLRRDGRDEFVHPKKSDAA